MEELILEEIYRERNYASCLYCKKLIRGARWDHIRKLGHALCGIKF